MTEDFRMLYHVISPNCKKIAQKVRLMRRMVAEIGTPHDTEELRYNIKQTERETRKMVKEAEHQLKMLDKASVTNYETSKEVRELMKKKLVDQFRENVSWLEEVSRQAKDSMKANKVQVGIELQNIKNAETGDATNDLLEYKSRSKQLCNQDESDSEELEKMLAAEFVVLDKKGEEVDLNEQSLSVKFSEGVAWVSKSKGFQTIKKRKTLIITAVILFLVFLVIYLAVKKD